jgi:hypothetical protein
MWRQVGWGGRAGEGSTSTEADPVEELMSVLSKRVFAFLFVVVVATFVAFWPYETRGIPEWDMQVVDKDGKPVPRGQVVQEWLNPIEQGIVNSDARETDLSGRVVFPQRILKNRLLFGLAPDKPSSHVFICWHGQFADVNWDGVSKEPPAVIQLEEGNCPYE